jgi:hypothetical protein
MVALILVLGNAVMQERNWTERETLFREFGNLSWPMAPTVRTRIEEVLNGLGVRADQWKYN